MGVNRFIDYANPMYWAKMLRKGGIPKRKPYSFTVKINQFDPGTEEYPNTVTANFGNSPVEFDATGKAVLSEVYDASKTVDFILNFNSTCTLDESGKGSGWEVSPESKWKITTKTGDVYEGTIGVEEGFGELFDITFTMDESGRYHTKIEMKNKYDCFIFNGCTLEFSPIFIKINDVLIFCNLMEQLGGEETHVSVDKYAPDIRLGNSGEWSKIIYRYIDIAGDNKGVDINLKLSDYTKFSSPDPENYPNAQVHAYIFWPVMNEGNGYIDISGTKDLNNIYHIKLWFGEASKMPTGYAHVGPATDPNYYVVACYFNYDTTTFATIKAHSNDKTKGLVQIDGGVQGETVEAYSIPTKQVTLKALPISTYTFEGWYDSTGELVSQNAEYTVDIVEGMKGQTTQYDAHFGAQEITFTARKKNYYDATITVERQKPDGTYDTLVNNVYEYSSTVFGDILKYGDILRCTLSYGSPGFENPKWYIGNQEIAGATTGPFMLDETTANIMYGLDLDANYGAVFVEVYPDEYKSQNLDITVYVMEKKGEITDRYKAAEYPFTDNTKWTRIIREENFWATEAVDLTEDKEYFVGLKVSPAVDGEGKEKVPYLSHWREAVESQVWGGAYNYVYNRTLNKESRYRLVRLSCYVCSEDEKNAKRGIFEVDTNQDQVVQGFAAKSLLGYKDDAQTLLSIYEKNPKCVFDKTSDNLVILRKAEKEVMVGETKYILDETGYTATSEPADLVDRISIDSSNHVRVIFKDAMKTAVNPVVTLHLKYNQQAQTEEEFLKTNIAEAKEKLADAIETLEKDYDDGKEDVIEETPVKDEPDTDEADVAEAVLATEPTEDNE